MVFVDLINEKRTYQPNSEIQPNVIMSEKEADVIGVTQSEKEKEIPKKRKCVKISKANRSRNKLKIALIHKFYRHRQRHNIDYLSNFPSATKTCTNQSI